jgi:hypothetical protein
MEISGPNLAPTLESKHLSEKRDPKNLKIKLV